jgi:heme iron utilization protein
MEELKKKMALEQMLKPFGDLRFVVLATSASGKPYTSLISFALTSDYHTLLFATSRFTSKYNNICNQPAVSILIDDRSQHADDLQNARAVTLVGTAEVLIEGAKKEEFTRLFLVKHPELAAFIDEPETSLIAVTIHQAIYVTRFQDVSYWP